jgi:hypothetical protein
LTQLRAASLRRWQRGDRPGELAALLRVPEWWVNEAIAADVAIVTYARDSKPKATAVQLAAELALPPSFVGYVMRAMHARNERKGFRQADG